jgi:hypothetical protein
MSKKTILSGLILAMLIQTSVYAQDALEISNKATQVIAFDAMEMTSTLKIIDNKGNVRTRQVSNSTKKFADVTKTLIKFISPADVKGTAMLIYDYENKDDDMWVYLPSLHKTRRIVSSEKSNSFMGSEFSNSDMSKPNTADFDYKLLGTETINGKVCWKVESKCKTEDIKKALKFSRKVSFIEKETYLTQKIEFYNLENKLFKTETMSDYKKFTSGKYFAYKMAIVNHLTNRKSEIIIDKLTEGSKLLESYFTTTNLEK